MPQPDQQIPLEPGHERARTGFVDGAQPRSVATGDTAFGPAACSDDFSRDDCLLPTLLPPGTYRITIRWAGPGDPIDETTSDGTVFTLTANLDDPAVAGLPPNQFRVVAGEDARIWLAHAVMVAMTTTVAQPTPTDTLPPTGMTGLSGTLLGVAIAAVVGGAAGVAAARRRRTMTL